MSESFDESGTESEPEVPVLPTRHVDGRKRSSHGGSTLKGLGSKRIRVQSYDRTNDVDEVIARINENTPLSRRKTGRENAAGRRATSASPSCVTPRAQKVTTTPQAKSSSKGTYKKSPLYVQKTPRSEKSSHRFRFEVDDSPNVGANLLPDPPEDDGGSDLDLAPEISTIPSSPTPSPVPSRPVSPPSNPPTPNVSVALKDITTLLNTVVKRMDRMESELKQRCSTVSSSSSNEPGKTPKSA